MCKLKKFRIIFWSLILVAILLVACLSQTTYATHRMHTFRVSRCGNELVIVRDYHYENEVIFFDNDKFNFLGNYYFITITRNRGLYVIEFGIDDLGSVLLIHPGASSVTLHGRRLNSARAIEHVTSGGGFAIANDEQDIVFIENGLDIHQQGIIRSALMVHVRRQELNAFIRIYGVILPISLLLGYYLYLKPQIKLGGIMPWIKTTSNENTNIKMKYLGFFIICLSVLSPLIFLIF